MPTHSLTLRRAAFAEHSSEVAVVLATITHPDLDAPIRLSSDPTTRLGEEPLRYGTVSNGETYEFVMMSAVLPDQIRGQSPRTSLVFENVAADSAKILRSITSPASITIELVLAASPDAVEERYSDLLATRGAYDADRITLDISREPFTSEPWPAGRMTQAQFPGLHR